MKITLSNWERVWLSTVVGSSQGTIAQVRLGNKALDSLEFSEKERRVVSLEQIGPGQWAWRQEYEWELEFPDDVWRLIVGYAQNFRGWPQDRRTEALYDKVVQDE